LIVATTLEGERMASCTIQQIICNRYSRNVFISESLTAHVLRRRLPREIHLVPAASPPNAVEFHSKKVIHAVTSRRCIKAPDRCLIYVLTTRRIILHPDSCASYDQFPVGLPIIKSPLNCVMLPTQRQQSTFRRRNCLTVCDGIFTECRSAPDEFRTARI
jgi:hypothetical protein